MKNWIFSKWGASFLWSFCPNSACGSIERRRPSGKCTPLYLRALSTLYFLSSRTSLKNWLTLVFIFSSLYLTLKAVEEVNIICVGGTTWDWFKIKSTFFCSVNEVKMPFECKYLFVYVCCMLMSFLSRKMDKCPWGVSADPF